MSISPPRHVTELATSCGCAHRQAAFPSRREARAARRLSCLGETVL